MESLDEKKPTKYVSLYIFMCICAYAIIQLSKISDCSNLTKSSMDSYRLLQTADFSLFKYAPQYFQKSIESYNQFHNIFRIFRIFRSFPFTGSETMGDYYL